MVESGLQCGWLHLHDLYIRVGSHAPSGIGFDYRRLNFSSLGCQLFIRSASIACSTSRRHRVIVFSPIIIGNVTTPTRERNRPNLISPSCLDLRQFLYTHTIPGKHSIFIERSGYDFRYGGIGSFSCGGTYE